MILQTIINGLVSGATYAAFAIGFTLVLGIHRVMNLAQGYLFTWGVIVALYCVTTWSFPWALAILTSVAAAGILSVASDILVFQPLQRRNAPESATMVASIGIGLILQRFAQQATDTEVLRFPANSAPHTVWDFGSAFLSSIQIIIILVTVATMIALALFMGATQRGRQMRAVAELPQTARLMGINPNSMRATTFFIAGAFAGLAGIFVAYAFNSISYVMGEPYLLVGMAALILGGMGSVLGAVAGSMIIGLAKSFTIIYVSDALSEALPFIVLFVVLVLRPQGLFGSGQSVVVRAGRL